MSSLKKQHTTSAHNNQGDSMGTIDDMLLDSNGKITNVSISVGGFLGVGSKMVEIPFSKLKFEPRKFNAKTGARIKNVVSTMATGKANANANGHDDNLVLPNVSKDQLNAMRAFTY